MSYDPLTVDLVPWLKEDGSEGKDLYVAQVTDHIHAQSSSAFIRIGHLPADSRVRVVQECSDGHTRCTEEVDARKVLRSSGLAVPLHPQAKAIAVRLSGPGGSSMDFPVAPGPVEFGRGWPDQVRLTGFQLRPTPDRMALAAELPPELRSASDSIDAAATPRLENLRDTGRPSGISWARAEGRPETAVRIDPGDLPEAIASNQELGEPFFYDRDRKLLRYRGFMCSTSYHYLARMGAGRVYAEALDYINEKSYDATFNAKRTWWKVWRRRDQVR